MKRLQSIVLVSAEDAIATRFFIYEKLKSLDKKVFGSKRLNPLVRVFLVGKLNIQLKNTESQDPEDELLFSQVFKKKQPTLALEPAVTVIEADNNSYDPQELIDELNNYHGQASQEVGDEFPSDSLAKAYNEVMEDINMMYNSVGPDEVNKTKITLPKIIIDKPAVNKYGSPIALLEGIDFNDDDGDKQDTEVPEEKLNDFRGFSIGNGGFRCGLPGNSRCPEEDGRTGPGYPGTREPTQEKVPEPADSQFTDSPIEPGQRSGGRNWQNSSPEGDEEEFPEYPDVIPSTPEKETGQSLPKRRMQQDRKNNLQSRKPKRVLKKPVFAKGNMRKLWSYHPVFKRPEGYTNADQLQQLSDREVASCDDLQLPTYADEVIRQLSPDTYQEISKILQVLRKDWRSLKPSSQAFLVARLADTNFMSDLTTIKCCCFGEYGNCFHEKNELPELSTCCLEMNQLCSAVHNEWKNVDFIVVDQDHVYEMLL